jgi:hypothetical protein
MHEIELLFLWKDSNSGGNGCPALIKTDGGYYVQGRIVTDEERTAIQAVSDANNAGLRADEDVLFVPDNVLDRLHS